MVTSAFVYREQPRPAPGIDAVWTVHTSPEPSSLQPYRAVADGCVDLVFRDRGGEDGAGELLVGGPTDRAATYLPVPGERLCGVRFAPGWAASSLQLQPSELLHRVVPARLISPQFAQLEQQLRACNGAAQAAGVLRTAALARAAEARPATLALEAVRLLRIGGTPLSVEKVAALLGTSTRTLRREVQRHAGLSPRKIARIFRMRRALDLLMHREAWSLCGVAAEAGYFDEAHMCREFQVLAGFTPGRAAHATYTARSVR